MRHDRKIAVYLTALDWKAVLLCLGDAGGYMGTATASVIGVARITYIKNRIEERLPAKA